MLWWMIEEGELDRYGKLFWKQIEEENGGLGDRKIVIAKRYVKFPRDN